MTHILIFGDSTTYGTWDSQGGWVARIRKRLDAKNIPKGKYVLVYNMGVSGGTTTQLVKRFESETQARLDDEEENIFIFAGGGNDAMWITKKKKNHVPLPTFKRNIQRTIRLARQYSDKIIILGIKPCDEAKTTPIPWYPTGSYRLKQFEKYNNILKKNCAEEKIPFINSFAKLNNKKFIATLEDGIHPNDRGHQMMEKIVWSALKKKKWI
jgi:lysophospholipase L1-like esterase